MVEDLGELDLPRSPWPEYYCCAFLIPQLLHCVTEERKEGGLSEIDYVWQPLMVSESMCSALGSTNQL